MRTAAGGGGVLAGWDCGSRVCDSMSLDRASTWHRVALRLCQVSTLGKPCAGRDPARLSRCDFLWGCNHFRTKRHCCCRAPPLPPPTLGSHSSVAPAGSVSGVEPEPPDSTVQEGHQVWDMHLWLPLGGQVAPSLCPPWFSSRSHLEQVAAEKASVAGTRVGSLQGRSQ